MTKAVTKANRDGERSRHRITVHSAVLFTLTKTKTKTKIALETKTK